MTGAWPVFDIYGCCRMHTQSTVEEYGCETQMHGKGVTELYNCVLLVVMPWLQLVRT